MYSLSAFVKPHYFSIFASDKKNNSDKARTPFVIALKPFLILLPEIIF